MYGIVLSCVSVCWCLMSHVVSYRNARLENAKKNLGKQEQSVPGVNVGVANDIVESFNTDDLEPTPPPLTEDLNDIRNSLNELAFDELEDLIASDINNNESSQTSETSQEITTSGHNSTENSSQTNSNSHSSSNTNSHSNSNSNSNCIDSNSSSNVNVMNNINVNNVNANVNHLNHLEMGRNFNENSFMNNNNNNKGRFTGYPNYQGVFIDK